MEALIPPPQEKKLPSPNEKLLRSPTFWERQGKAAKWLAIGSIILFLFLMLSILLLPSQKSTITPTQPTQPLISTTTAAINAIEISTDKKSILTTNTKETILTILDTQRYLELAGNARYRGECFIDTALSNKKDSIVFSTGCLSGDVQQAWIGIYKINDDEKNLDNTKCVGNTKCANPRSEKVRLITTGSGKNFIWSQDDTTITYEADPDLSGLTKTRTIDSNTGEILEKKNNPPKQTYD